MRTQIFITPRPFVLPLVPFGVGGHVLRFGLLVLLVEHVAEIEELGCGGAEEHEENGENVHRRGRRCSLLGEDVVGIESGASCCLLEPCPDVASFMYAKNSRRTGLTFPADLRIFC